MSFPAYPSYREIGTKWLDRIPANWTLERLKRVATLNPSKSEVGHLDDDVELSFLPMEAIGETGAIDVSRTRPVSEVRNGYSYFADGDVVFAKVTPCFENGKGALIDGLIGGCGFGTTELTILRPNEPTNAHFLRWLIFSELFRGPGSGEMLGAGGLKRVPDDFVATFPVPWPTPSERRAIAAFLDRETAKIDALVEEQRRLIKLLREKRQAVISNAVTKGLDPLVPMKDSGVEWLGDVPAHWEVRRLGSLFREVADAGWDALPVLSVSIHDGVSDAEIPEHEMDRKVTRSEDRSKYKVVRPNDLVYNMMRAWQGGFGTVTVDGCVSPAYVVARPTAELDTQYIEWLLRTPMLIEEMRRRSVGVADFRLRLYWDEFKDMMVALPPLTEQQGLVSAIQAEIERLDALSEQASGASSLLQERRAALISAAVTGKIDVRGSARVLPFPMDRSRARGLVAVEVIERSTHQPTFGRVKFQKIAFLAEAHASIGELAGSYTREAAGPLDRTLITEMENGAGTIAGVTVDQSGGAGTVVSYRLSQRRGAHRQELADWLEPDRLARLDKLIADFTDLSTKGAEAVATLYAVWNDALIEGAPPTDDEIIAGFLNDWHPEKREKFRADELPAWLDWMRRHGIVPTGSGPKTSTGRLLV